MSDVVGTERGEELELLPGEPSTSRERADVAHWIAVYSELIEVLGGQPEADGLLARMVLLEERRGFWRQRLGELPEEPMAAPVILPEAPEPA